MHIDNLTAKNVRSLKDVSIDFQKGINLISGIPGQGKSTLLELIKLHLLNSGYTKLEDMIQWEKDSFSSNLICQLNKDTVSSEYKYKKTSNRSLVVNDKEDERLTKSDAVKWWTQNLDAQLTEAAVFSHQGDINITSVTPSERRDLLKKVFNLEFIAEKNRLEEKNEENKRLLDSIKVDIQALSQKEYKLPKIEDLPYTDEEYAKFEKSIKSISNKITLIGKNIDAWTSKKEELKKIQDSLSVLKTSLTEKEDNLSSKEEALKCLPTELEEKKKEQEEKLKTLKTSIIRTPDTETTLNNLKEQLSKIRIERIKAFDSQRLTEVNNAILLIDNDIKTIKENITLFEQGICPTCGEPCDSKKDEEEQKLISKNKEKEELETEQSSLEKDKKKYDQDKLDQDKAKKDKEVLESKIISEEENILTKKELYQSKLNERDTAISSIEKQLASLDTLYTEKTNNLKEEIKTIQGTIDTQKKEIEEKELEVSEFKLEDEPVDNREDLEKEKATYEENIKEQDRVITVNTERESRIKEIEKEKKQDKKDLKAKETKKDGLEQIASRIKVAKDFFMSKFPNYVITELLTSIEFHMNRFMIEVYGGRYEVKIQENKRKTGIEILYGKEGPFADTRNASGFEKSLLKLSWTVGLLKLAGLNLLILDEPDASAPVAESEKLYRLIGSYSREWDQTIIITHKQEIRDLLKNEYDAIEFEVANGEVKEI